LKDHPESLANLPPILVLNGKFEDGAHRVSAIWLLQQRMDPKNPLWKNAKLNVQFVKQGVAEDKNNTFSSEQVLNYVKSIHPEGEFNIDYVITDHPKWTLTQVPISKLHIIDPESEQEIVDPYNRVHDTNLQHVDRLVQQIANIIQKKPIVVDREGHVLDGNHRALAALKAGLKTIPAYIPT
jgi:hypothetical protein